MRNCHGCLIYLDPGVFDICEGFMVRVWKYVESYSCGPFMRQNFCYTSTIRHWRHHVFRLSIDPNIFPSVFPSIHLSIHPDNSDHFYIHLSPFLYVSVKKIFLDIEFPIMKIRKLWDTHLCNGNSYGCKSAPLHWSGSHVEKLKWLPFCKIKRSTKTGSGVRGKEVLHEHAEMVRW